jgi:probable HAF family extracellular repeat protein
LLPGGYIGEALAISDTGEVVGDSNSGATFWPHAFSWTKANGMIDLGTLPGDSWSEALSVNKNGQIVGYSAYPNPLRAVLWTTAGPQDLNKLIPANSGWNILSLASGINNAGQIVGQGTVMNAQGAWVTHAFLLTPVN